MCGSACISQYYSSLCILVEVCLCECVFVHHTCSRAELAPGVTPSGQRVLRGEEYGNAAITGWYSTTLNMGFKSV